MPGHYRPRSRAGIGPRHRSGAVRLGPSRTGVGTLMVGASLAREAARRLDLPIPPTPLIGREQELAEVQRRLLDPHVRLLTLTGTGGTGKTRLALAVAQRLKAAFEDGAVFADLSPLSDAELVLPTLARSLGLREIAGQHPLTTVVDELRSRQMLVVLDNVEHVLGAVAELATLLEACPGLRVLATSRIPLRLYGEHEFPVPPLALPDPRGPRDVASLAHSPAVALFVQRAQAVRPDFQLTEANAAAVAEICARLDGLPLAIELAAARVKLLPPQALLARFDSRLRLLTGGARDLPARHQTLRGAIDWSYSLLEPAEQALFRRLGVFVGGATLEAVAAVWDGAGELDVLEGLTSLLDKSLLRQGEGADGEPRFGMLETIHEYALEKLAEHGELDRAQRAHAAFFLALAEQAEPKLRGFEQPAWLSRLDREHDNLRAALRWATERGETEIALRLAGALWLFWRVHGPLSEGQRWLDLALGLAGNVPPAARAKALSRAGSLAWARGDYDRAVALCQASLGLARTLGDPWEIAFPLIYLGHVSRGRGDYAAARAYHQDCLELFRASGDAWGISVALDNLGLVEGDLGRYDAARALQEESLALGRELGDEWGIAISLVNLAAIARRQGDPERARALAQEGLERLWQQGAKREIAECLELLASLAAGAGQMESAARLFGATEALRAALGVELSPTERAAQARALAAVQAALRPAAFDTAWSEGMALPLEQVVQLALALPQPPVAPSARPAVLAGPWGVLTPREREVAQLIARGYTSRQIAEALVISERTADTHAEHIRAKLDVRSRAEIAAWVARHQPLPEPDQS